MDSLVSSLGEMGYQRGGMVEERGQVCVRGGILDVFPPAFASPIRIEFFGDEVESIRAFEVSNQRSTKRLNAVKILPAKEAMLTKGAWSHALSKIIDRAGDLDLPRDEWEPLRDRIKSGACQDMLCTHSMLPLFYPSLDSIFDYLKKDSIVAMIEPDRIFKETDSFGEEVKRSSLTLSTKKRFFLRPEELFLDRAGFEQRASCFQRLYMESLISGGYAIGSSSNMDLSRSIRFEKTREEPLAPLAERINSWIDQGMSVFISAHNNGQAQRTKELLETYGFSPRTISGSAVIDIKDKGPKGFSVAIGEISSGFAIPSESIAVISEEEVFGERIKARPPRKRGLKVFEGGLEDLKDGDLVVHRLHGIGMYKGLKRIAVNDVENDFLVLEYSEGARLYLPVWNMDIIARYQGVEGHAPPIDRLGGKGFERRKKRVKRAVERLAGELIKLYAQREVLEGFAYSRPHELFREFEESFEFTETPDQAKAIEDTLSDMASDKPMDRLICGDVGYGKTEVAIRAAFLAALDRKQTAILVPTTVLAQQHFLTFSKRLSPYPVTVDVLSRFKARKGQEDVLKRLASGGLDIVIGTHRMLQKDVAFKDLGLVVIDEEHRFGVRHKERLKAMKRSVDCLSLTATPIPRTLQMSLAGIREISIINTPPEDRLSIKTNVVRFDESVIAEAIEREIKRGGQVFFVHNRIQSMPAMKRFLEGIAPYARIAVAHGQTNEVELEKKMLGFVNREFDVLLSTAIIESGLDIPTANTIIINRADRFGLAELYQLRGRVGRISHRAYAYFICPEPGDLSDIARKRMGVIQELSEPGSGFRVASYDLEIRGAGELLGTSQSGFILDVGLEMYAELLKSAVSELKGEDIKEETEPEISLKVSQYIPDDYMPEVAQRVSMYKRLATAGEEGELYEIEDELRDVYGDPPRLLKNLIQTMSLKLMLKKAGAKELSQKGLRLYITFSDLSSSSLGAKVAERAVAMARDEANRFRVTPDARLIVFLKTEENPLEASLSVLKELLKGCYT
jgi:transcription-repair coupling factor (superfamily II helicase)